ncbi:solute:sodium symporter (SSS) family transporter [Streptococcus urinalis FB127-CNA-2]|uniref:Transporter, SSS family n=1 Tax=Streptococcus urinalis 2285-97 TaxID=764291 RepID=G5KHA0_9STRE|nr:sodium:solute symporter [Streptococcus urinalis]EHJ57379.1 transporter, SSS family [Streptococcus urinalis 2285-97]EKS21083.1 solute:sodium symporter (SSS) family transporter [Streptococcus urinalis FB127-CNA-2]VEF31092.1 sodium:solute symporter family protein [Streptococcus urinalis]
MSDSGFTLIDLAIIIVYLIAVLAVGLILSKKEMQGKEFFKGDGSIPWYVTAFSIFATLLSPISFMALAGNSYAGTWLMFFAQLGMVIAIPLAIRFFLPIYAYLDIDSAYHYLELRFNSRKLRALSAIFFIIYQVGRMSIIMYLPSVALSILTGIDVNTLIIVMGIIAIIYSYTGGIKSVLWTDFIQGLVLFIGVIIALLFLIHDLDGGLTAISDQLIHHGKFLAADQPLFNPNLLQSSVFLLIVGAGVNTLSSYMSSQDIVQRFTTTQDIKKLNKMMFTNGFLSIFISIFFYLIGTGLYVLYTIQSPSSTVQSLPQDQVFMYYISAGLPVGITGIMIAAIYAAAQSTLSTGLNSVATSWTLDIQDAISKDLTDKQRTKMAQYISLGVGIFSIVVSIIMAHSNIKSAYEWFNGFMGLVLGVLGGIFILAAFFKRSNKYGAWAALVTSSIVMIAIKYGVSAEAVNFWSYGIISVIVSVISGLLVSYLTPKTETPFGTTIYDIKAIKSDQSWKVRN